MKLAFGELDLAKKGTLVVAVSDGETLSASASLLDERTGGAVRRAIDASRFSGKHGETLDILAPAGIEARRLVLIGLGKLADLTQVKAESLGGTIVASLLSAPESQASIAVDPVVEGTLSALDIAVAMAFGAKLRRYRFDRYRTKEKKDDKPKLDKLTFMLGDPSAAKKAWRAREAVAEGIHYARDLVSEPGNTLYPESYAERLRGLSESGLDVEILNEKELRKLGMGALMGVGQGAEHGPRVVVLRWNGGSEGAAPIALIGKGVTFDSGGLSLKPAKSMEDMKWDMAGSAAVVGTMLALAGREAKVNAVGIIGLVENMPSGSAQRPGDVVTSMSGQTIEVLNTDAEGRLVLADILWYAVEKFKPAAMIDLATLTGAIITALGHEHAGLFANNDPLADAIIAAGKQSGETVWRLPLGDAYDKLLKSDIADMKNIGDGSAGSIVAAQFLQRFVQDVPWAHLDIAALAWASKDAPLHAKGATGWGVRLLDQLVKDVYEK